ncbi:MAG: EAL domain-containing protein [Nitriliruptorales bacterium]|nr:EAL domain-containing protein [Nitriliruptorales bacterium]
MVELQTATATEREHLDLVRSVALAANAALRVEDVLHVALDAVAAYLKWPVGIVWLPLDDVWQPAFWYADDERVLDRLRVRTGPVTTSEGVLGAMLATGAPGSAWRLVPGEPGSAAAIEAGFEAAAAFTVRVGQEPVAALQGLCRTADRPSRSVLAAMETICAQVARVIERDRSHTELRRNETEFAAAQRLSRVGSWSWDVGQDDLRWSAQMFDNYDTTAPEFGGNYRALLDRVHPADRGKVDDAFTDARLSGAPFTVEHRVATVPPRWIRLHGTVDHDSHGQVRRLWGTAQDITDIAARLTQPRQAGTLRAMDGEERDRAFRELLLREDLQHAVARDELRLEYQPVVALQDGSLTGLEALVRWQRSSGELVGSTDFVPLAEDLGLISELGRWVLREACHELARWQKVFGAPQTVAVNVSPAQLLDPGFPDHVTTSLDDYGLSPEALVLEITESALSGELDQVARQVTALRRIGVQLVLDDFGTGFSSMSRLRELPLDGLKIDRSFLAPVASVDSQPPVLRALFALADHLDLKVIAEGVEHPVQLAVLLGHDCDEAQGFLFAPPVPPDRVNAYLADPACALTDL